MSSDRSVVPVGAVAVAARARGTELRKVRNLLRKVDKHSNEFDVSCRKSIHSAEDATIQPPSEETKKLRLFNDRDALTNMILVVEGVDLYVHKEILAGWSPVFMTMFSSSFIETANNKVVMSGKHLNDVRLLLNCLYPPNTHTVTEENVMTLLPLIEEYDISALKLKCEEIILQYEPSLDIILIAHEYNMPRVMEKAIEACAELSLNSIDHTKNKELTEHIPPYYIMDIYRKKIETQSEELKLYRKLKQRVSSLYIKLDKWGKSSNSYPCEKHRVFAENCSLCLQNFRSHTFQLIQEVLDSHLH